MNKGAAAAAASISSILRRDLHKSGGLPKHYWLPSSSFSRSAAAVSDTPSPLPKAKERGSTRWSKWLLFLPCAIIFGLGTWHNSRRQDKIKMLEYRRSRLAMQPVKFDFISPSGEQLDSLEFRRVPCKGIYDDERSIYVGPHSRSIFSGD